MVVLITVGLWILLGSMAQAADPMTATYDVWLSRSDLAAPFTPYHDCMTFDFDGARWTVALAGCPPAGPASVRPGNLSVFTGRTCLGSTNIIIVGWFLNGTAFGLLGDTIGGVMASPTTTKTWGFGGVRNDACVP